MKLLIVAPDDKWRELADSLAAEFEIACAADPAHALLSAQERAPDAALVHLDLGVSVALDLICELRRGAERAPGIVVVGREFDRRATVELVRTGAYDVVPERPLHARELAHALRNAAYHARSAASLERRREARSKEVLVVGEGEGARSIVALLQAAGFSVRQSPHAPQAAGKPGPRAIVVDLATFRDSEALIRLLGAG
jgi:DNA-binding response OmpR family regulator